MHQIQTSITTAAGELAALVWHPGTGEPLPGVVLVDGSGDSSTSDAGEWPATFAACGAAVLVHDKPGCGDSPGDWRNQSFADRADEALAAVEVLRRQPGVDPNRVGLLGMSQGGWVAYLAAATVPEAVHQIATIAGPGVSVAEQERHRLFVSVDGDPEAMAWADERTRRLVAGEDPKTVIADQQAYRKQAWYADACDIYESPELVSFLAGILAFDPSGVLGQIRCPVFAAFGGADSLVPVERSVAILNERLPQDPRHALAVFPNADHNLLIGEYDAVVPLAERLAPGYLAMLADWLIR